MDEFQGMTEFQGDFQGDYQTEDDKRRKVKTMIVAGVAALVVVIVAVWGISSIIGSVNSKKTDTTVATTDEKKTNNDDSVASGKGELSPASQYTAQTEKTDDAPVLEEVAPVKPAATAPETGPTDLLFTAVLMGIATTLFMTNRSLKTREA